MDTKTVHKDSKGNELSIGDKVYFTCKYMPNKQVFVGNILRIGRVKATIAVGIEGFNRTYNYYKEPCELTKVGDEEYIPVTKAEIEALKPQTLPPVYDYHGKEINLYDIVSFKRKGTDKHRATGTVVKIGKQKMTIYIGPKEYSMKEAHKVTIVNKYKENQWT